MEEKEKIQPISNGVASHIATFGDEKDYITVECVANFINYFNFINTPRTKQKKYKINEIDYTESEDINYTFLDNPIVQLIFSQINTMVLDNKKVKPITKEKLAEMLDIHPNLFIEIFQAIMEHSMERGKGLKVI